MTSATAPRAPGWSWLPGSSQVSRAARRVVGDSKARTLLPVQAFHSMGEALFALSLVGSLFFNVSVDAARSRIILYLALTMAPFLFLAPLLGPLIDRVKGGHRWVLLASNAGRLVLALALATQLKSLAFYPLAFLIVVLAKVHLIARNALVPSIVRDLDRLVLVNSRLARTGAVAGLTGGLIGAGLLTVADAPVVLWAAAAAYGVAALASLGVPPPRAAVEDTPEIVEMTEMHGPGIGQAAMAMAGLRFATGFVFFHVGFSLKTAGEPVWLLAAVGGCGAFGGFLGTFAAPRLRRRFNGQTVLSIALGLLLFCLAVSALRFHGATAAFLSLGLGLAGSIGRRAFDGVVQTEAPHARRGRAYAWLETRLEIAWVVGSLMAVLIRADNWLGLIILGVLVGIMLLERVADIWSSDRLGAETEMATLPLRLLDTAETLKARGDAQQAAVLAREAVDVAVALGHAQHPPPVFRDVDPVDIAEVSDVDELLAEARLAITPAQPAPHARSGPLADQQH